MLQSSRKANQWLVTSRLISWLLSEQHSLILSLPLFTQSCRPASHWENRSRNGLSKGYEKYHLHSYPTNSSTVELVWTDEMQSRFVESVMNNYPISSIQFCMPSAFNTTSTCKATHLSCSSTQTEELGWR